VRGLAAGLIAVALAAGMLAGLRPVWAQIVQVLATAY